MKLKVRLLLTTTVLVGVLGLGLAGISKGGDLDYSSLLGLVSPAVVSVQALVDPEEGTWATASGFLIDPKGRVITSCHAVLNATQVIVEFRDGSRYEATVDRCSDEDAEAKLFDLAVLQLQGVNGYLPRLWLGDSTDVKLGQGVFVISYPGPYGELNIADGQISGRLKRQYLTLGNDVYRAVFLARLGVEWDKEEKEGWITDVGEILDLDTTHPSLADLAAFARKDTLVLAIEEPREDNLFCGVVSSTGGQEIIVEKVSCFWVILFGLLEKTGEAAKLNREIEFLKTTVPLTEESRGGPVFNLNGQVIGTVSWGRGVELEIDEEEEEIKVHYWPGTTYIVPAEAIKALLGGS